MPTIGVAIAIPEPYGEQLRRYRASFGDPVAEFVPAHVTLLPPMDVAESELEDVYRKLDDAAGEHQRFTMRLRGTGTFRPVSPVVFVAVSEGISNTEILAKSVRSGLLRGELVFPYHPHVTVAHQLDDAALDYAFDCLAGYECKFEVQSFALYLHDDDAGWKPHREFELP